MFVARVTSPKNASWGRIESGTGVRIFYVGFDDAVGLPTPAAEAGFDGDFAGFGQPDSPQVKGE